MTHTPRTHFLAEGAELDELMQQQSDMLARIEEQNLWELDRRVGAALRALRCPPPEASIAVLYATPVFGLSLGGFFRRFPLAFCV